MDDLPRSIILLNPEFYEIVLSLLDNEKLKIDAITLLKRLPASPVLVKEIINLKGIKKETNSEVEPLLHTKNSSKLLYILTIIEYLMENSSSHAETSDTST